MSKFSNVMIGSSLQTIPFDSCSIGKEYLATHELDDIATRHADLCALCEQATTQQLPTSNCISHLSASASPTYLLAS